MSQDIYVEKIGESGPALFWGHGWGQSGAALLPLAQSLQKVARHWVVDFPGFGKSPVPNDAWGTEEYAQATSELINTHSNDKVIWVGHSFGCRVGLQLAARYPDKIAALCLISAAGLPRKRPLWHKLYHGGRIKLFKFLKTLIPRGLSQDWLYTKFGSADYRNAGPLRQTFVKVVNEDLSELAKTVQCPVLLIYGSNDTETPPELGERFSRLIPNAKLILMDGFDHYSILTGAQHQVVKHINGLIKDIS